MNFAVKPLSEADAPAAAEIEKVCFSTPWSEETLRSELLNPQNRFFGAFSEEETLLGYIGAQFVADEDSVFNVAVLPEFRRNGVGKALVKTMIAEAKKENAATIYLEVRAANLGAITLYEKQGFVFCGIRKNYYTNPTENALLMKLVLSGEAEHEDPIECWDED